MNEIIHYVLKFQGSLRVKAARVLQKRVKNLSLVLAEYIYIYVFMKSVTEIFIMNVHFPVLLL